MFGIWGHDKAAEITYYGLHSMQHRGQDGAGIVVNNEGNLKLHKDVGLVNDVFKRVNFSEFPGRAAIGHIRNATQDDGTFNNVQPLIFRSLNNSMAIAHNGKIVNSETIRRDLEESGSIFQPTSDTKVLANLMKQNGQETTKELIIEAVKKVVDTNGKMINSETIRRHLEESGSIFQTTSDTEVLAHLMKQNGQETTEELIIEALKKVVGAYGYMIMTEDKMFVALDPRGIRPLSLGKL